MQEKLKPLKQEDRKKVLLLCDDIRMSSGIATMAREIVIGTAHHYNWINLGAALSNPDAGKILSLSDEVNRITGLKDSNVRVLPNIGYGDADTIRHLMRLEKPDIVMIFTDPRYWTWLFDIEREIRSTIPIAYLSIWDSTPAPLYNEAFYESVDLHMCISKQTKALTKSILERTELEIIDLG